MIQFRGKIINNLCHALNMVRCTPSSISLGDVLPFDKEEFIAYGLKRIIGSCYYLVASELIEILWNIQEPFNSEFYGITNVDSFNTTVLIPETMSANYYFFMRNFST